MSEKVVVKRYANSEYAQEPLQATEGSAAYDLYAAQCKTLFSSSDTAIPAEFRLAIPKGYFGKIYLRLGLQR